MKFSSEKYFFEDELAEIEQKLHESIQAGRRSEG